LLNVKNVDVKTNSTAELGIHFAINSCFYWYDFIFSWYRQWPDSGVYWL